MKEKLYHKHFERIIKMKMKNKASNKQNKQKKKGKKQNPWKMHSLEKQSVWQN
jgi:hypothetical protein